MHDFHILQHSQLFTILNNGHVLLYGIVWFLTQYHIIGDAAYELSTNVMVPQLGVNDLGST